MTDLMRYTIDPDTDCWVWNGPRIAGGYGSVPARKGESSRAHRRIYELHRGPIPDGLELDHTCQNPPCVNPKHLDPVTRLEHCRRTMQRLGKDDLHLAAVSLRRDGYKFREIAAALRYSHPASAHSALRYALAKGLISDEELGRKRFTNNAERMQMIDLYCSGWSQTEIASEYGLHSSQVSRIVRGMRSGHETRPPRNYSQPSRRNPVKILNERQKSVLAHVDLAGVALTARQVADACGIPEQSARTVLLSLERYGFVEHAGIGLRGGAAYSLRRRHTPPEKPADTRHDTAPTTNVDA